MANPSPREPILEIRDFDFSDADYQAVADLDRLEEPENADSAEQWRFWDRQRDPKHAFARYIFSRGGEMVADGSWSEPSWSYRPGKLHVGWTMHPVLAGAEDEAFVADFLLGHVQARKADTATAYVKEDKTRRRAVLEARGFVVEQRDPYSRLDLTRFDPEPFLDYRRRVAESGIAIQPLAVLQERDPEYRRKLYDLDWEIDQDIPQPEPPTRMAFERWCGWFERPGFRPDAYFVALDGERYVGLSTLKIREEAPQFMHVGLTGTLREYRRRGIAMALKLEAIDFAMAQGGAWIETDNEENNPMYQINLRLGFAPRPAGLSYVLKLGG
jgi:ribosomal protein S18 acetylase RimI-like enzyme